MKNKSSAFSLIELSIVILIIGVLIAGVTQASRLVRQSKLSTAKTLTQSSPVNSLRGVVLWLETTMDASLKDSEEVDGTAITKWYDANPQATLPNTFTGSAGVTYKATGGTNALPAISFASGSAITGTLVDTPFSAYTIFMVTRSTSVAAANTIFYNGVSGTSGFGINKTATSGFTSLIGYGITAITDSVSGNGQLANANSADILVMTIAPNSVLGVLTTTPAVATWRNGISGTGGSLSTNLTAATSSFVLGNLTSGGTTSPFLGEISELIIFDSVLKKSDRQDVEKYLSKKYAIAVVQS